MDDLEKIKKIKENKQIQDWIMYILLDSFFENQNILNYEESQKIFQLFSKNDNDFGGLTQNGFRYIRRSPLVFNKNIRLQCIQTQDNFSLYETDMIWLIYSEDHDKFIVSNQFIFLKKMFNLYKRCEEENLNLV